MKYHEEGVAALRQDQDPHVPIEPTAELLFDELLAHGNSVESGRLLLKGIALLAQQERLVGKQRAVL